MGRQSARMVYKNADHKDIYFQGMYHTQMYVGSSLVWEKTRHPRYSQYFMVNPMLSHYGSQLIDEYGVRLDANEGAVIEKCGVYLQQSGTVWKRTIACVGSNLTSAKYVPYLAYRGDIVYDGLITSGINTYVLKRASNGVWNVENTYKMITADLTDANGSDLTIFQIGVQSMNTKLFYNLTEMKNWLTT